MAEVIFIGLSLSSILLLIALGLTIIYGAMGVINMAHGELVMIGAYTSVLAGIYLGFNLIAALPLAFLVAAGIGYLIERIVIRHLYGRLLDTLLATWGIAIILKQSIRLEFGLTFFDIHVEGLGPGLQNVAIPAFLNQPWSVLGLEIQSYRTFHHPADGLSGDRDLVSDVPDLVRCSGPRDHAQPGHGGGLWH